MLHQQSTLNCNGKLLDLSVPIVMGILNLTPDSFYDGGKLNKDSALLKQVEKMLKDGATILDVGGMSSRPGARVIDTEEELNRVIPAIQLITKNFPEAIISIDTVKARVVDEAINLGISMVNDISAGSLDPKLLEVVAKYKVPYILMHMRGRPENMQSGIEYEDVVLEIVDFFIEKIGQLRSLGIKDIILDPGFGFGKEKEHNFRLLRELASFKILGLPILAGISRKSFIYKTLNISVNESLTGTIALHFAALSNGAKILRVHDVKEAVETIKIWRAYSGNN